MRRIALALLCCALVAACSGDDDTDPAAADAPTTTAAPATTTTTARPCEPADGYTPGTSTHTVATPEGDRPFLVHLPPEPTANMPLVVNFHGATSNMEQQHVYSGFTPLADEHGFVVASPNGIDAAIRQWRFLGPEDLEFARLVVDELVARACVDAERVFATGISSGSAMSTHLACEATDVFHGFGLVAAVFYNEGFCGAAEPRPIAIFHGTEDFVVRYEGGAVNAPSADGIPSPSVEEAAAGWAEHHGCDPTPTETEVTSEVVRHDWSNCDAPVVLYEIVGGGHTWPGADVAVERLGSTTDDIEATETMLELWGVIGSE